MKSLRTGMSLLGLAMGLAAPARAQMQAMPVYFAPKGGIGITLDGDYGRVSSAKLGGTSFAAHPTAIGGRAYVGLPFVTLGAGASVYDPKIVGVASETQLMGSASL